MDKEYSKAYDFNKPVTSNIKLYAKWSILRFTISFYSNGGTKVDNQFVEYNQKALEPLVPRRNGYIFDGWYIDTSFNEVYNFDEVITKDFTLYAKWNAISYRVVFKSNGENVTGTMDEQVFNYDIEQNLSANGFAKTGYTFDGWNTNNDGTGTKYLDKALVSNLSDENDAIVNLYAQWSANEYKVHFDGNGNTGGYMKEQTFVYDKAQNLSANGFVKSGYSFIGWIDGTGKNYSDGAEIMNLLTENGDSITLFAQWTKEKYTITFKSDSKTVYQTITQDYETVVTVPEDPTRLGYKFAGWDKEIPETMPAEDMTITAEWIPINYVITYILNGGNEPGNPKTYTINDSFTLANPTKEKYIFTGWTGTGLNETTMDVKIEIGSTGDRTYTANWEKEPHTINVIGKNGINYILKGEIGETITLPSFLEGKREDATVLAWFKDGDFKNEISTYKVEGIENETIYAWLYSSSDFCLIQSYSDLIILSDRINNGSNNERWRKGKYKLSTEAKITINYPTWSGIGNAANKFDGVFDGNNCEIKFQKQNYYSKTGTAGLFGYVGTKGTVMNVKIIGELYTDSDNLGSIANINYGSIEDCIFSGTIEGMGQVTGGIAGKNYGEIIGGNTVIKGLQIIKGGQYVGGISGENWGEISGWIVKNSLIIATWINWNEDSKYVGGITGYNYEDATVTECEFINSTVANEEYKTNQFSGSFFGGIAGYNKGNISLCTVSGKGQDYTVVTNYGAGGIAGRNDGNGLISQCTVFDAYIKSLSRSGGLVGLISGYSKISECLVGDYTEIDSGGFSGGIIGWASVEVTPVPYIVSDCTVDETVIIKVKVTNREYVGQLFGNPSQLEDTTWLIDCMSDANLTTY